MVLVLNFLNALGTDGSFGQENSQKSVLSEIGRSLTPVFKPMGISQDNWPATVGVFTGVLAKEDVVGTLNALYSQMAANISATIEPEAEFSLQQALVDAAATIPENLIAVADNILDPLGLNVGDLSNLDLAASDQDVSTATFLAMQASFDGQTGAFAYLLFILLYAPCVAATTAIYRETNISWTLFVLFWTTYIAYMSATIFYQAMTYTQHSDYSFRWIVGLIVSFIVILIGLWITGKVLQKKEHKTEAINDSIGS